MFFLAFGVRFCACGFVQHINRDWTAKTALLAAEGSMDLFVDLFTASLSCPGYQYFLSLLSRLSAWTSGDDAYDALLEEVGAKSLLYSWTEARTGKH